VGYPPLFAELSHQQKDPRQSLLAGIEKLVHQIVLIASAAGVPQKVNGRGGAHNSGGPDTLEGSCAFFPRNKVAGCVWSVLTTLIIVYQDILVAKWAAPTLLSGFLS
jgi:hypothetical protein